MNLKYLLLFLFKKNKFLSIMRITVFLLFFGSFQLFALNLDAQAKIELNANSVTIKELIDVIEEQTDFLVLFRNNDVKVNRVVTLDDRKGSLSAILDEAFDGTDINYEFRNKYIVLSNENAGSQVITQSGKRISGKVSDANGEPIIGASVIEKGTNNGVNTDANGNFLLNVGDNAILQFSYLGYAAKEIPVRNQTQINVILDEDVQSLNEVVVVGYGQQKKVSLTGAVSQVSGQDILQHPGTNVTNSLQGLMPGVTILRSSGQPGSENSGLRIRGFTSVNGVNALVLVDGVESGLDMLNPDDIESISVLKDASSASIYGSRAAGGVVLVTTKRGAPQKITINYDGSAGINVPGMMPQRMPPWEEQQYILDARIAALDVIEFPSDFSEWLANPNYMRDLHPSAINRYQSAIGNSNWIYEGLRPYTATQRHALSVNGGHGKTSYFISGGYYTQNGLFKYGPDNNNRYNLRLNLATEFNKYMDFKLIASYENNITNRNSVSHESIMNDLYTARGRENMYLPEDDINYAKDPYSSDLIANPIRAMKFAGTDITQNYFTTANANLHIKNVVKGLTLDLNASRRFGTYSREIDRVYLPGQGRNGPRGDYNTNSPNSNVQKIKNESKQDKLEALLNYKSDFGKHSLAVLAGASYEQFMRDQIDIRAYGLLSDELFSFNFYDSGTATNSVLNDAINQWKMASLFGRINYSYANRYLLEFVTRYDGSSRLAPGNRFGFFPGGSVGWVLSEEPFFEKGRNIINFLKLRASYGEVGNSTALGSMYYPYIGTIYRSTDPVTGRYMGEPFYYQREMISKDISWETVTTTNAAVDMAFLKSRLNMTAEYFWKTNNDMLSRLAPGNLVGIEVLPYENVGAMKIWGWEISAGWRDKIGNVHYSVTFNIDDSSNKLVDYKGINTISPGTVQLIEGYPMYTLWGYQTNGFWNSRDEYLAYKAANPGYQSWQDARLAGGDVRYVAQGKANHTIGSIGSSTPDDPGDLIYLGDATPHYAFGFNLGLQWKGFDFACFLQGIGKRKFFINSTALTPLGSAAQMPWTINRDYWREDNKDAYFARLYESGSHNYQYADRWLQNGAYIRMKNIQLGYTVPLKKYVQKLRIYVTGNDVWEYTKMLKAWDPEYGNNTETRTSEGTLNNRVSRSYYPFMRTWTGGINITF